MCPFCSKLAKKVQVFDSTTSLCFYVKSICINIPDKDICHRYSDLDTDNPHKPDCNGKIPAVHRLVVRVQAILCIVVYRQRS